MAQAPEGGSRSGRAGLCFAASSASNAATASNAASVSNAAEEPP